MLSVTVNGGGGIMFFFPSFGKVVQFHLRKGMPEYIKDE